MHILIDIEFKQRIVRFTRSGRLLMLRGLLQMLLVKLLLLLVVLLLELHVLRLDPVNKVFSWELRLGQFDIWNGFDDVDELVAVQLVVKDIKRCYESLTRRVPQILLDFVSNVRRVIVVPGDITLVYGHFLLVVNIFRLEIVVLNALIMLEICAINLF